MAQPVVLRVERDDGRVFSIDNETWMIPNDGLEGWAELPHSVTTRDYGGGYDGGFVTNQRVGVADRSVKAVLADWRLNESARARAIAFFAPNRAYKAHLTYGGRERWAEGVQSGFKCSVGNIYEPVEFEWTLLSGMPYLLDEDDHSGDSSQATGMFGFPFLCLAEGAGAEHALVDGFICGVANDGATSIYNGGDAEAWPVLRLTMVEDCTGPWVKINGEGVVLNQACGEGDVFVVDLASRPIVLTLNGEDVTGSIGSASSLDTGNGLPDFSRMALKPKVRNSVEVGCDGEVSSVVRLAFSYRARYNGI